FDRALAIDSGRSALWNDRGICAQVLAGPEAAIIFFDRALALDATNARAWYNRGVAQQSIGEFAAAISSLEHVLTLDGGEESASAARRLQARDRIAACRRALRDADEALPRARVG